MNNRHNGFNQRRLRSINGGTIIDGSCAIFLLISIAYPLFIYFANLSAQVVLQMQVAAIATQAAQTTDEGRYWMGQPRPGFTQQQAQDKATEAAKALCTARGFKNPTVTVSTETNIDYDLTICDVNVTAPEKIPFRLTFFGYDFASTFSGSVGARGVAAHARIKPYAIVHMDAPTTKDESYTRPLGFNQRDVAVIPAYGFFYNATGTPGASVTPYGAGIAPDITPENGFSMNHYFVKPTDITTALGGTQVKKSSWNSARRIDNKTVNF